MNPDHHWRIEPLLKSDIDYIETNGIKRNQNGQALGWKTKAKDNSPKWNILGMAGEWAVGLVLNIPIGRILSDSKAELNSGDLLDFIEVKTSNYTEPRFWNLVCNKDNLKDDRVYVLVLTHRYPEALEVVGWASGKEIRTAGRSALNNGTGHAIWIYNYSALRDVNSLFDEVAKRKKPEKITLQASIADI